jgi:hypothetical protein
MILKSLTCTNFKGLRNFTFQPGPGVTNIFGANKSGKTTLFNAWLWLLFGKDCEGRADYEIKTRVDGQVIPDIEHSVEAVLDVGSREVTLKRVYLEKWGKRGQKRGDLLGHETKYYVDGVPKRESDYKAEIVRLIRSDKCSFGTAEDRFKLLTDPHWFAEGLKWQERRVFVLSVCGDVTDAEVVAADSTLAVLGDFLAKHHYKVDDYREILKASRTKLNKDIEEIKPRIDEVHKGLPVLANAGIKREDVEGELHVLRTRRQGDQDELNALRSSGGVQDKQNQLRTVEADITHELTAAKQAILKEMADLDTQRQAKVSARNGLFDDVKRYERSIKDCEAEYDKLAKRRDELLKEWQSINNPPEVTVTLTPDKCPTCGCPGKCPECGHVMAEEVLQAAIDMALAATNQRRSQRLKEIDSEGQENKGKRLKLVENMTSLKTNIDSAQGRIGTLDGEAEAVAELIRRLKVRFEQVQNQPQDLAPSEKYTALAEQRRTILADIERLRAGTSDADKVLEDAIATLDASIAEAEHTLGQLDQRDKGLKRIKELETKQKTLGGEYETVEKNLALTDLFVTTKVRLLESHINERFAFARFKMFNPLISGGVEECCEVVGADGVPYGSLNGEARLNVGMDIINTMATHWGMVAPVWIDQAGEVTDIIETAGQQVRLFVSPEDKTLRIENGG